MKRTLLTLAVVLFAAAAGAQSVSDPKYGSGCVPERDGRVIFERTIATTGLSSAEIMENATRWAKGRFVEPIVLSADIREGKGPDDAVTVNARENIIFKKSPFETDMAKMDYSFEFRVSDGRCLMTVTDISYTYEDEREGGGFEYTAEEWITDKEAFNKKFTKLRKATGKFRVKTIDLVDTLAKELESALN
ncbi:MAG: DUF4468 domain-containing protein [Bacteroidaceae bacterium]|nr:DUF4468 domain-containing protein [Bacteroidaceae bacterium]